MKRKVRPQDVLNFPRLEANFRLHWNGEYGEIAPAPHLKNKSYPIDRLITGLGWEEIKVAVPEIVYLFSRIIYGPLNGICFHFVCQQ